MSNFSAERQAIESLLAAAQPAHGNRFDPELIHGLSQDKEGDLPDMIYLQKTESFAAVPDVGNFCVAVYGGIKPKTPFNKSQDMKNPAVDRGILIRRPDESSPLEMIEAARVTQYLGIKPAFAWIVELLAPVSKDSAVPTSDLLKPTGNFKAYVPSV